MNDPQKLGKIIAFASPRGADGKTTTALAYTRMLHWVSDEAVTNGAAEKPLRTVLVDMDVRDGLVGRHLGFKSNSKEGRAITSLRDVMDDTPLTHELMQEHLAFSKRLGAHILLSPGHSRIDMKRIDSEFYTQVLHVLRQMFDVVVIDTGLSASVDTLSMVYLEADTILLIQPISNDYRLPFILESLNQWADQVTKNLGLDLNKVGVVHNYYSDDYEGHTPEIQEFFDTRIKEVGRARVDKDGHERLWVLNNVDVLLGNRKNYEAYRELVESTLGE